MKYQKYLVDIKQTNIETAIKAACEIFCEKGIENITMTDIAEKAQIGVASLYRYFDTKENLVILCGARLWQELAKELIPRFKTENYLKSSGIEQIRQLISVYKYLYQSKKNFVRFLTEFDSFCVNHKIEKKLLSAYEESLHWSFCYFTDAYNKGISDGTIADKQDMKKMYVTVNHALMAVLKKILQGEIIEEDDFKDDWELQILSSMILDYIKK